ncbi:unnamed protein product [Parnassius apollo]|uniref:Essential MCU regulator, mitochondrial n=1 Tax=Parnassius apollo TaxID=110799 RepID=A0A8S3XXC5_PARAO|nr:unnamed protein product [Parnassius apollo]
MQSGRPQIHKMHENTVTVFKTLLEWYIDDAYVSRNEVGLIQIDNPRHYKSIDDLYLAAKVSASVSPSSVSTSSNALHQEDIEAFKLKCLDFFIEGANQVEKRHKQMIVQKRTATTTPTGAILPEPEKTPFGLLGSFAAA